ncbi:RNA polymerase sigma-70 factor [Bacteroides intestinalis]|jgi:RNA polymerase sigma-70 factor (ECF subfamily)|uniref:RNA polymerase sigma-70 factor n=1 Tax=Bacteroides intestinalis TaxID=329854 RepID=A0AB37MG57_9BACE|nr:RNA polymerase sigma-70 factor [Bacteroides intestinalis]MBD9093648.1 RNA polymerase sigma-70 factor [Bacteroides oleiciplenus]RGK23607.1 RNA polymerase sigma-70 factor [Bacteroides intestinalis]RHN09118.1 RNA polymerase sigma-70 factor [Bacteroides intestinalis]
MYATDILNDERALVLRLIGGDEDAFCELYAAYKNRLIYFAMRFLKSREYAEDVFQDAFTVVWQSRRFIDPDASFSSYLYTIIRNRLLNQLRDAANEEKLKESILSQALDYTDDTKREVMLNDLKFIISRALEQLTPRQRKIFEMSREAQLSHKEIAGELGISVNTVQEHISSSLKIIRTYLIKYSGSEYTDIILLLTCLGMQ